MKLRTFFLIMIALFVVDLTFGQGCSQCKLIAEQGSELGEDAFGSNINSGIMYLMAMPYFIVLTVLLIVYRKQVGAKIKGMVSKG